MPAGKPRKKSGLIRWIKASHGTKQRLRNIRAIAKRKELEKKRLIEELKEDGERIE
ncbi:MAG TPA: hypothetical protein VI977_01240 [archaeon]|nr:hypothetical protein [archaeon]